MRILNLTAHRAEIWDDNNDRVYNMFSIECCGIVIVKEEIDVYNTDDDELEIWAAGRLKELFDRTKKAGT